MRTLAMGTVWLPFRPMNGSTTSIRRVLLLANPISGGGKGRRLAPELATALAARGVAADIHLTTAAGDAMARARAAADQPYDALVALGGDGTVNEVLNGMPDPSRPLGVLPIGTANVLALELRLPRAPVAAAAVIAAGHLRELAIGRCGDRRFLLFAGVGVDGTVVQRLHQVRSGTLGKHKWLAPILHTTRHWPRHSLRVTFPGGEVVDGCSEVLVTRVRNYGGVVMLPKPVSIDSGRLHVLCFRRQSRIWWVWQGLRGVLRCMRANDRTLLLRTVDAVRIDGNAPFQVDGDFGGTGPVAVDLLPQRARLLVPPHRLDS
jgi:diacylglycerol kinase family enzyme